MSIFWRGLADAGDGDRQRRGIARSRNKAATRIGFTKGLLPAAARLPVLINPIPMPLPRLCPPMIKKSLPQGK
jgi:hypothetical protein